MIIGLKQGDRLIQNEIFGPVINQGRVAGTADVGGAGLPHRGFKSSGHGKDLSMYVLEDYTRIKHVMAYTG